MHEGRTIMDYPDVDSFFDDVEQNMKEMLFLGSSFIVFMTHTTAEVLRFTLQPRLNMIMVLKSCLDLQTVYSS